MKKINKYYLILIILILYSFIQFLEWFKYSTLISNFVSKKNEITKNEVKKRNLVNVLKKKNKISIEQYEERFIEIFDYLPNKNEGALIHKMYTYFFLHEKYWDHL